MNRSSQRPVQDPARETRAIPPPAIERFQPVRVARRRQGTRLSSCSCLLASLLLGGLLVMCLAAVYFLAPFRTNLLVLGIDRVPEGTALGRSDTMILVSVDPLKPTVLMLSIPRDLWVSIPDFGENRINTAHFFAEANQPGSGPSAALQTVEQNFSIQVPYYARVRFDAFFTSSTPWVE